MEFVYQAHSGLRHLVLLAGIVAALYLAFGWLTSRPYDRPARIVMAAFVGLLDLQVLLGIVLVLLRPWSGALIGHIVMMVLALVAAHGFSVASRRATVPKRGYGLALAGVVLALVLIVGGIMAIQRGVFQMTAP